MADDEIGFMTAQALAENYKSGALSPVEVTKAILARIDRLNDDINAYCFVDHEGAIKQAKESETRWRDGKPRSRIDGVPASVKDLVVAKGWETGRGSLVANSPAGDEDAPAVQRLREAGCVLTGKTTTPEMGWKGVTDCPRTGITRNPWNLEKTPGGSSGGASAQVAAGLGQLAIGTDGGGSIRIPSGFAGIAGLKPSFGRVPAWPLSHFGTVSHLGPMARSVTDCAMMLSVMAGYDARDWFSLPPQNIHYEDHLDKPLTGLRVAFSPRLGFARVDEEIAALVRDAVKVIEGLGAIVEEVDPPVGDCLDLFQVHWFAGASKALRPFDDAQRAQMDPGIVDAAERGEALSLETYLDAVGERGAIGIAMRQFHARYDVLLTPTLPITAFEAGQLTPRGEPAGEGQWVTWTPFSYPFNLTQQPAATVPCGFASDGLPAGLQIVGPMHDDTLVLRVAKAYEAACQWMEKKPQMATG